MTDRTRSAAVLRTSLAAALIGLGLVAGAGGAPSAQDSAPGPSGPVRLASRGWEGMIAVGDGSTDGMRRTAQAFAALGDHAVASQCFRLADELAVARRRI